MKRKRSKNSFHGDHEFYREPTAAEVDRLWRSHGAEAVAERWWYIHPRSLFDIRKGKTTRGQKAA